MELDQFATNPRDAADTDHKANVLRFRPCNKLVHKRRNAPFFWYLRDPKSFMYTHTHIQKHTCTHTYTFRTIQSSGQRSIQIPTLRHKLYMYANTEKHTHKHTQRLNEKVKNSSVAFLGVYKPFLIYQWWHWWTVSSWEGPGRSWTSAPRGGQLGELMSRGEMFLKACHAHPALSLVLFPIFIWGSERW